MSNTETESRLSTLETNEKHNQRAWDAQIIANSDLYKRTEANTLSTTSQGKIMRIILWLIATVTTALLGLFLTVVGSLVIHWLIAGKPGIE